MPQALRQVGFPRLIVREFTAAKVRPYGPNCLDWTCGWEWSAQATFDIQVGVWAGTIVGAGTICLLFGTETAGIACTLAASIFSVISAVAYPTPTYTGKCLYAGIGAGQVVKLVDC